MSRTTTPTRKCKCGKDLLPSMSGWVCPNCDAKLIPYEAREKEEIRPCDRSVAQDEKICPECHGTGVEECPECDGDGEVTCDYNHEHECPECDGTGEVPCQACY